MNEGFQALLADQLAARAALVDSLTAMLRALGVVRPEVHAPMVLARMLDAPPGTLAVALLGDALKHLRNGGVIAVEAAPARSPRTPRPASVPSRARTPAAGRGK